MPRSLRLIAIPVVEAAFCALLSAQVIQPQGRRFVPFPPEIVLDRFIDVAKVAPKYVTVEMENSEVRVLRARLPGEARIPIHDARSGAIVAVTDVQLRITTPDKKFRDLHIKAGETHWIDGDTFSEQNLSSSPCEFLYLETKRPKNPNTDNPPG